LQAIQQRVDHYWDQVRKVEGGTKPTKLKEDKP